MRPKLYRKLTPWLTHPKVKTPLRWSSKARAAFVTWSSLCSFRSYLPYPNQSPQAKNTRKVKVHPPDVPRLWVCHSMSRTQENSQGRSINSLKFASSHIHPHTKHPKTIYHLSINSPIPPLQDIKSKNRLHQIDVAAILFRVFPFLGAADCRCW